MTFPGAIGICFDEIEQAKASLIYLLGADDAGKTMLSKELANQLILKNKKVAVIDADSGQSSWLPLTLSLNYAQREFRQLSELSLADWDFMPSYDLLECFERYIRLMGKWIRKAKEEVDYCLVDSNGDIREALKLRELEILNPDLVVALQRGSELEPILANLENRILRLPVPEEVKRKSWKQRKGIRDEKLKLYFKDSSMQTINCEIPSDFTHRIVGLYAREKFSGLGIAEDRDVKRLSENYDLGMRGDLNSREKQL